MKVGKAYAFFDPETSKEELEEELSTRRTLIPSRLEFSLSKDNIKLFNTVFRGAYDSVFKYGKQHVNLGMLKRIMCMAAGEEFNYVVEATHPNITNKRTALELNRILRGVRFDRVIVYEEKGNMFFYIF